MLLDVRVSAKECQHHLKADKFAQFNDGSVAIISAAGQIQAVRAMAAAMQSNNSYCSLTCGGATGHKHGSGYLAKRHRLAYSFGQVVLISKEPSLLPNVTDLGLWQVLKGLRYTTPLLRSWVPWLRGELLRTDRLQMLRADGCAPGQLTITDAELDELVSFGVNRGHLKIEKEAA